MKLSLIVMLFYNNCSYFFFRNPYSAYYKALVANAATSALRLHQRQPRLHFSREFIASVLLEDSFHYMFYSLIFLLEESKKLGYSIKSFYFVKRFRQENRFSEQLSFIILCIKVSLLVFLNKKNRRIWE